MVFGWSYRNPWLSWIKTPLVQRPQCWCYLMFVLFPADKQNDNYYSRLWCPWQTSKNAIQQTLKPTASLGTKKAKSQARICPFGLSQTQALRS